MRDALAQALSSYRNERRPQQMGALSGDWNVTSLGSVGELGSAQELAKPAPFPPVPPAGDAAIDRRVVSALVGSAAGALAGYGIVSLLRLLVSSG